MKKLMVCLLLVSAGLCRAEDLRPYQDYVREAETTLNEFNIWIERAQTHITNRDHALEFFHLRSVCQDLINQIQAKTQQFAKTTDYPDRARVILADIKSLNDDYTKAVNDLRSFVEGIQ